MLAANAGEHHFARVAARCQHALQFASGDDVEARTQTREHVEDGEIRVGFHRVADEMLTTLQSRAELAIAVGQCRA
jgi:hypothetical protein